MKKTRHLGSQGGLRHSLRGSGRIKKTILKGDKFEFAEKLREKRNYVLYVSGVGHETKEIEEIDDFMPQSPPTEEIIEERQIIDNYQYHETKNCKKNQKKLNTTHHERLSIPFEKKTLLKYSSYTTQSQPKSYAKTKTVKTSRFGKTLDVEEINPYNSLTLKLGKNKSTTPSNLYETYKSNKNTSLTKTKRATSPEGRNLPSSSINNIYKSRNIYQLGKDKRLFSSSNLIKYKPNQNGIKDKPNRTYTLNFGEYQTRTETKKNGEYLIKITTSRQQINGPNPYKKIDASKSKYRAGKLINQQRFTPEYRSRSGSEPRGRRNSDINNIKPKFGENPRPCSRLSPYNGPKKEDKLKPYGRAYGPKTGDKPRLYAGPHGLKLGDIPRSYDKPKSGNEPKPYGVTLGPKPGDNPKPYGGPYGSRPDNIQRPYGKPQWPKSGDLSKTYNGTNRSKLGDNPKPYGGPHGPTLGDRPKPYGAPHKPNPGDKQKPYGQKPLNNKGSYGLPHETKIIDRAGPYGGPKLGVKRRPIERLKSFDKPKFTFSYKNPHGLRPTSGHGLRGPNDSKMRPASRNKSIESPKFNERTFNGRRDRPDVVKPRFDNKAFPSKRLGSHSREDNRLSGGKYIPSHSYKILTENNYTSPSRKQDKRTQMKFQNNKGPSNGDDNYNYYESKHIIKHGRLNLPITIHHRRGEEDNSSQKYQRNSSYNKTSQKLSPNLSRKYIKNSKLKINNKSNIRQDNSRNIQKSIYRKETYTITNRIGGRLNENNSRRDLTPDTRKGREIKAFSQYQKYGQKSKLNYNNSKYQLNQSTDVRSNLSKYQYNDDNDLIVIYCPVHGKRTFRKSKLRELGIILN